MPITFFALNITKEAFLRTEIRVDFYISSLIPSAYVQKYFDDVIISCRIVLLNLLSLISAKNNFVTKKKWRNFWMMYEVLTFQVMMALFDFFLHACRDALPCFACKESECDMRRRSTIVCIYAKNDLQRTSRIFIESPLVFLDFYVIFINNKSGIYLL